MNSVKEINLPKVKGSEINELPESLYIPPKALLLLLDVFSGPMDFLLYLIQRKNLDILEVNLVDITDQYISYISLMDTMEYELAGDYLSMAAYLAEIKSRILLPRDQEDDEVDSDPKAELIRRLQEYQRFKAVSLEIDELPRVDRDIFGAAVKLPEFELPKPRNFYDKNDLSFALRSILEQLNNLQSHKVTLENQSLGETKKFLISMNHPLRYRNTTYFQASFGENDTKSILQVVQNPGWLFPYISCIVIMAGLSWQFLLYLIPFFRRKVT